MTFEDILANANYNIEKIVEELRKRITDISGITEIIDKTQIIYQFSGIDFCVIKVKKDHLEIDFRADNTLVDPIDFSWKIGRAKKSIFDRRMHMKNIFDIDTVFGIISQSYRCADKNKRPSKNVKYVK